MKAETQATHLLKMMQTQKHYSSYELTLPFFFIKHSALKKLAPHDVLLIGLSKLELQLVKKGKVCAIALWDKEGIKILGIQEETNIALHTKKYETIKCSLGMLSGTKLEVGHRVHTLQFDMEEVTLYLKGRKLAKGRLVNVDDEIAIAITEVHKNEK